MADSGGSAAGTWDAGFKLPPLTLDGTNALLSPDVCASFDPDAFLLSRRLAALPTPHLDEPPEQGAPSEQLIVQQDLFAILAELRDHSTHLSDELAEAINRDYRQFVGLASEVRKEVPRIERLAHQEPSTAHPDSITNTSSAQQPNEGVIGLRAAVAETRQGLAELHDGLAQLVAERSRAQRTDAYLERLLRLDSEIDSLQLRLQSAPVNRTSQEPTGRSATVDHVTQGDDDLYSDEEEDEIPFNSSGASSPDTASLKSASLLNGHRPGPSLIHPSTLLDVSHRLARLQTTLESLQQERQRSQSESKEQDEEDVSIESSTGPLADAFVFTLMDKAGVCRDQLFDATEAVIGMLLSRDSASGSLLFRHRSPSQNEDTHLGRLRTTDPPRPQLEPEQEQRLWFTHCLSILSNQVGPARSEGGQHASSPAAKLLLTRLVEPLLDPVLSTDFLASPTSAPTTSTNALESVQSDLLQVQAQGCTLADLIASSSTSRTQDSSHQSLATCYNTVLRLARTELRPFVELFSSKGVQLDLFVQVIWPYVLDLLENRLDTLFFVGHPDAFHTNYLLTQAFLSQLVFTLRPPGSRPQWNEQIWSAPSYARFSRRWPMAVYWQLRMRSIVAQFEPALAAEGGLGRSSTPRFQLDSCAAVDDALHTLWDARVAIDDLLSRQWKSTLHLVSRFSHWLEDTIDAHDLVPSFVPDPSEAVNVNGASGRATPDMVRSSTPVSRTGTPNALAQQDRFQVLQSQQDARAVRAMRLAADLSLLWTKVQELFDHAIAPAIVRVAGSDSAEATEMIAALRSTWLTTWSFAQPTAVPMQLITSAVVPVLKHQVTEPLKQPRHIATQYRTSLAAAGMQGQGTPSKVSGSSPFVSQFTQALTDLFTSPTTKDAAMALPPPLKRALLERVSHSIFSGFGNALSGVKETQASLRRLKMSNHALGLGFAAALFSGSSSANAPEPEDDELVRLTAQTETDLGTLEANVSRAYEVAGAGEPNWHDSTWLDLVQIVKGDVAQSNQK